MPTLPKKKDSYIQNIFHIFKLVLYLNHLPQSEKTLIKSRSVFMAGSDLQKWMQIRLITNKCFIQHCFY